jgi:hypothetical protein
MENFPPTGYIDQQMKRTKQNTPPPPPKPVVAETPPMGAGPAPTPEAEASVANHLPKREQLKEFEKDLEEHDPGNQPA